MPLARYFFFVGSALLALLFVLDAALPSLPVVDRTDVAASLPIIRINSERRWPERVVIDTSLPTIATAQTATAQASIPGPEVADVSAKARVREAFAQLQPVNAAKFEPPPQQKRKTARRRLGPPMIVAQQPRLGFFANNIW
jgi:hypothetical protein